LGDWILIATASLPSSDIRRRFDNKNEDSDNNKKGGWGKKKRSGLSLFGKDGQTLNPFQKSIQKKIQVTQRIRNDGNTGGSGISGEYTINRVDNVIEFTPLDTLEDIIPESSSPLFNLVSKVNVNPLQVKKGKVILVHKAEVESEKPILRTKIAWTSTVFNVAGTSQFFDPEGADIFGVNNLLGELIQKGTFDTPFVDEDIRISRTSGPVSETLRVFVRQSSSILDDESMLLNSLSTELRVEEEKEVDSSSESIDVGIQVKKVADATEDVQKAVSSMAKNARSTIENDMNSVSKALGDSMDDVVSKVQDAVEDDLEEIGKAVESVVQSATEGGGKIDEAISNVTKAVAKVPTDVTDIVEQGASDLGNKVVKTLDSMVADVQDSVESDLKDVGKSIESVRDATTGSADEKKEDDTEAKDDAKEKLAKKKSKKKNNKGKKKGKK